MLTDASKPTERPPSGDSTAPARATRPAAARKTATRRSATAAGAAKAPANEAAAGTPARTPAKKAAAKTPARTPAKKTPAARAAAKKAPARKTAPRKAAPRKTAPRKASTPRARAKTTDLLPDDPDGLGGLGGPDGTSSEDGATSGTPHRPSRRHLIVGAAIRVFAHKGFSEASIQEIADEAGVVATAVYYHFAGKEELFEAALTRGLDASDAVIAAARPDDAHADAQIFRSVIRASWDWAESSPDMARLLFLHMPGGATPVARTLARDYLERHARRAYDYFESAPIPTNRRRAAAEYAARTLTVRTVMGLTLSVHSLQMDGGPLSSVSSAKMVDATARLCERLFKGA